MKLYKLPIFVLLATGISSCSPKVGDTLTPTNNNPKSAIEKLAIPSTFDFGTTGSVKFDISTFDNTEKPIRGIVVSIYSYPDDKLLIKGVTSQGGVIQLTQRIPTYIKQVAVRPNFIGLPSEFIVDIINNSIKVVFGGKNQTSPSKVRESELLHNNFRKPSETNIQYPPIVTLGKWNTKGVPEYLELTKDALSDDFLANIDATVPEHRSVTKSNPNYLNLLNKNTLSITELADVWITFVHEGASWTNSLGFYTYNLSTPPSKMADISSVTLIFPNVSYNGSGGGLNSGDKVKIGRFPAGTGIGFVIFANAYNSTKGTVEDGIYAHFSHEALNVESKAELRRHLIAFNDPTSNRLLLSFEDVDRENPGCDQDFNDAIFFASSNPVKAISKENIPTIISKIDRDGDGVSDIKDEYPFDPLRAINNYTPTKNSFSSLAFEDLWPYSGDYDMNDLVINYQFNEVFNSNNQVAELNAKVYVKAALANIQNGWGFQLPILPTTVKSVSGQSLRYNVISNSSNGTENEQNLATIIAFDNATDYIIDGKSDTLALKIAFTSAVDKLTLGTAPYNSFIFQTKSRGNEVHLTNQAPTLKMDKSLLGKGNDRSNALTGVYYRNESNLPWAINLTEDFKYPLEGKPIIEGYLFFQKWAESGGTSFQDWYLDKTGYRNTGNLTK